MLFEENDIIITCLWRTSCFPLIPFHSFPPQNSSLCWILYLSLWFYHIYRGTRWKKTGSLPLDNQEYLFLSLCKQETHFYSFWTITLLSDWFVMRLAFSNLHDCHGKGQGARFLNTWVSNFIELAKEVSLKRRVTWLEIAFSWLLMRVNFFPMLSGLLDFYLCEVFV